MPPSKFTENLSELTQAFSRMFPANKERVIVYVEGHNDVSFWYDILQTCSKEKSIDFDIQFPSKKLTKGKAAVLEHTNITGKHLILCIDSDYDYLLQGRTNQSKIINENKHIFQTYAYSIENLNCYSESLRSVCVRATTNSNQKIILPELLKLYSNIVYKLLLWSLYFATKNDTTTFTVNDFSNLVKILENPDINTQCKAAILDVRQKVKTKIAELEQTHSSDIQKIESLSKELRELGLNENNAYLFMHVHTLFDNVILMVLKPLCRELKKEKEQEIRKKAKDSQEINNEIKHYKNQVQEVEKVLSTNTDFKTCPLYQKIKTDLDIYIQNFN